jgi:hypothetical protein
LVITRNRCTSAGQERDCRKITREVMDKGVMDRRGGEEVMKGEPRVKLNCSIL